jgi:HK97 family phage major capsid protein
MADTPNTIMEAIDGIQRSFHEFKKVETDRQAAEAAGNISRMTELQTTLEKINDEISGYQKNKEILERKLAQQQERIEIVEAVNARPGKTAAEKAKDEHKGLFLKLLRSGLEDQSVKSQIQALSAKDVSLTDAAGGYAVPEEISRMVDNLVLKRSAIVENVKNVQAGTSDYKELISVNETSYAWSSESGTRNAQAEPTLRQRTPTWGELYTYLTASNWSLQDIFFNVEAWLADTASEAFANGLSASLYNGNGSAQLTGIVNGAPVTTDDGSPLRSAEVIEYIPISVPASPYTSGIPAKSLIDLVYAVKPEYAANGKFAMNRNTQAAIRKLTDTTGQFLWQPSLQAGQPDRLLGYEVFTWTDLGNHSTANAYPVVFGDFKRAYTLVTRSGLSVIRENVTAPGFTKFYMSRRYGGILTNNDAIKCIKVALS